MKKVKLDILREEDESVAKRIAEKYETAGSEEKERIYRLSEKKFAKETKQETIINEEGFEVSGVEQYRKPKLIYHMTAAAAVFLVIVGMIGGFSLRNEYNEEADKLKEESLPYSAEILERLMDTGRDALIYAGTDSTLYDSGFLFHSSGGSFNTEAVMFYDYEKKERTVLCARDDCNHMIASCVSKLIGDRPIIYDGYIYYFTSYESIGSYNSAYEKNAKTKLMRIKPDSTKPELIADFESFINDCNSGLCIKDNILYFTLSTNSDYATHYLCSIDLDTHEVEKYRVASGENANLNIYINGVYNGKLQVSCSKYTLGTFEYSDFEFDTEEKRLTLSELPYPKYADEDTYVYGVHGGTEINTTIVIDKDKEYIVPYTDEYYSNCIVYSNKVFFNSCWFDLADMSRHSYGELSEKNYRITAYNNGNYYFLRGADVMILSEEELLSLG